MTTLHHVELGVLGPLQVRQRGAPVAIPGAKPRAILTMLGLHGGALVPADTLVELLWGEDPPRTAAKALQTHISALRRTLGDGVVLTQGAGWILAETDVDASRYKSAARLGRDAVAVGDTGQAVARFEEALALWRGTPELPDGRRGTSEKTRWIEGHAALVEDRADALLATGRAAEIVGELEAAVAEAPLRERRWGQLMLALYRVGRQGEALAAYQRARAQLADELGVDPGPELRRLEAAIVAQDSSLDIAVAQQLPSVTRAVTFLLTDIEGSTAAWEADAAAMAVALARHDELVEQVVTSRGGRLIKTRGEGDATFSVFERPSGAAAAAIELQDAIAHEPWELAGPMRIRVALHTGEVELRDGDYFGRAVNRAARLRSLAEGGQILCSGATAELVIDSLPDDVVLADLGMRQLRNLPRPEHVFELRLETGAPPPDVADVPMERPALPAVLVGPGPFVGRGRELDGLLSAWQTALVGGMRAVLIAGEPGVGKTRLAGEWSRRAYEQGAVVLYGRCDEDLGAPYQPFAEALRALVPCVGADRLRGLRGVEALLPLVPGLTDVLPDVAAPTRADPDTERYALFDAVVALLGVASLSAPVVLILDDLHWAAKPTLLLLRHLLRFGEHARVQIIGTYRSTDLDRSHPLAAMLADLHRDGTANRLQLSGLDEDDVSAYVAEAGYDDEELARALASVTGGNPFFLIEALRHVDESGGRWDPSTLPQGVREAVSRRLTRLAAETNTALAAAAVVGSRFALELVERVVGDDLVDAFDEACKAGIVIEEPGGRYRFNHALVRQSLLAELPSVRRMRLHQRIAATLESEPGASEELLAELAYHYFECAWAGNAAKAVEYCRRAADQAMARLAYEGAADLYDRALHALEEIDDELPDRDDQVAALLIARCEALLAAGDVASAAGAVSQLQRVTVDSARLAAWATCFDGQLSMLIHPERLDEVESAVAAAAVKLAQIADAAGEAKAHTVRAGCLARLGRIGDCEIALDDALTAARRAGEHRRVNAVLANAPLAALWGPNPVPRAGGRCLDVVRLLRITTDSPAVEATSTRCQAVLEAFRGRAAAARRMIDSARRTVTELGLRHALLEVEQFAGIVELVIDDPAAAEPHLRKAYNGFRRMGLDADTAETAALLGRACLALGREDAADELCSESERLAGHALKASIAWRTLRARLLSRGGDHGEARRVAEDAVSVAGHTDLLVDHGDACHTLATVLRAAGDHAGAHTAAERAADLYERKGAAALAERARDVLGERPAPPTTAEVPNVEPANACVRAVGKVVAAIDHEAWDELEQIFAPNVIVESRRKVVRFVLDNLATGTWPNEVRRLSENGALRFRIADVIAMRGERLALTRLAVGTDDTAPGAPQDEFLQVQAIDEEGRVTLQVWFDVEDIDAAMAELDATHARFEEERPRPPRLDNACVRTVRALDAAYDREAWEEIAQHVAAVVFCESRRKIVGISPADLPYSEWECEARRFREILAPVRHDDTVVAVRGERLALTRLEVGPTDLSPGAARDELLQLYGVDEEGRLCLQVWFDVEDIDAAMAELDAVQARFEKLHPRPPLANAASRAYERLHAYFAARNWDAITELLTDDYYGDDRRSVVGAGIRLGPDAAIDDYRSAADIEVTDAGSDVIAVRGARLALTRSHYSRSGQEPEGFRVDFLQIVDIDSEDRIAALIAFDLDDFDSAIAELDARYLAGEAAAYAHTWLVITGAYAALNRHEIAATTPDFASIDHRRGTKFAPGDLIAYVRATWDLAQDGSTYIEAVHRLNSLVAVVTHVTHGRSQEGFDAEWREVFLITVEGDLLSRCELFDEADLGTALARFDQLNRPAPRLENAASQLYERFKVCYAAHDWNAITEMLADNITTEDRRRVVNAGLRHGPDAVIAELSGLADVVETITSEIIATRGARLLLSRSRTETHETFHTDFLDVVEVGADGRAVARVVFDPDDFDAAIAELDRRYLAGEAAAHGQTWSVVAQTYAAANSQQLRLTPDCVNIDHRQARGFAPGELTEYMRATWVIAPNVRGYVETVHRLSHFGAVVTHVVRGSLQEGFDAEWREVILLTFGGDLVNRCELFDEADLDAALAQFDQLSRPTRRLENTASRTVDKFLAHFAVRDWDAMAEQLADNISTEDRRRVVNAGVRQDRDAELKDFRSAADLGVTNATSDIIATRGERLVLIRSRLSRSDKESDAFHVDLLWLLEINADRRIAAWVTFDLNDFDAAVAELDARYLAGEAADDARIWSIVAGSYAALNRHELPSTAPDCVNIDHRQETAFGPGDVTAYIRTGWDANQDINIYVEVVHRLNSSGAVVTYAAHETSREGFDAEWRGVAVFTVERDMINRTEVFDEADLDTALARFDQLSRSAARLENTAARVFEDVWSHFAAGDWDALGETVSENYLGLDHRLVVKAEIQHGRDVVVRDLQAAAEVGFTIWMLNAIAIRGERLVLARVRAAGRDPEAIQNDALSVIEIDADNRIAVAVTFDLDDFVAAIAELDARYLAGEAAAHANTWSVLAAGYAALNRRELPKTTLDFENIDHRLGAPFAPGDLPEYLRAGWELDQDGKHYIEAVHRLSDLGAFVTVAAYGTSREGFDAEWRGVSLFTVCGDAVNRCELFDEADLDTALAKFDQLSQPTPRLENAASQVYERYKRYFAARDWAAMAEILADDIRTDDRRRVVNAGVQQGRDVNIADIRALAEVGSNISSAVLAVRGERLVLCKSRFSGRDRGPGAFNGELLSVIEIDADNRITAGAVFDLDDFDAAVAELDARYIAGEATAHARMWSVIVGGYAALSRRELPATTPDFENIDHRRGITYAPGDLLEYLRAGWDLGQDVKPYIEVVHQLSDLGAVVTHAASGTSREGFDAEWREVALFMADGNAFNRCELFDEEDLDVAITRFEELHRQAPRLENAASQVGERYLAHFAAHDWDAMTEMLADNFSNDDRRRVVGSGVQHGRNAQIVDARAVASLWSSNVTWTVMATRGGRLVLTRLRFPQRDQGPEAFLSEVLAILEINADERIAALVTFDLDDIDAAFEELDARYLAGEAADHGHSWSVITRGYSAVNQHELPAMATDSVFIDHRSVVTTDPEGLAAYLPAVWDLMPDISVYIEAVHRLRDRGAVITHAAHGTSQEGFDAEWRVINIFTFEGDLISRCEVFDEAELDAALTRFDELHPHAPRLENTASQVFQRYLSHWVARDWDAVANMLTDDVFNDDRRRVVNAGLRLGRDATIASMRASASFGLSTVTSTVIATRGERLALGRDRFSVRDQRSEEVIAEVLGIVEIDADERIVARVALDLDDIDAAFEELDARYLVGEAADHAHRWSVVVKAYATLNKQELPQTADWVTVDHRAHATFKGDDFTAFISAGWALAPDMKIHVEAVHRLSGIGAVLTHRADGSSPEGFNAEWRLVILLTFEADRINRCELFDEADLDTALARFEELCPPAPRLENVASRTYERLWKCFMARDWVALAETLAHDIVDEDRRRVLNAGIRRGRDAEMENLRVTAELGTTNVTPTVVAIRGKRLALSRVRLGVGQQPAAFNSEVLRVIETDSDERIVFAVVFDLDDIDAAFAELDARYLAGEAAAHAHTWSVIAGVYASANRREIAGTTPDWVNIDHRRGAAFASGDMTAYIQAAWDDSPDTMVYIAAVHRLSNSGAVVTHVAHGISQEGFDAEWRDVHILTVEGDLISGSELFDEADLETSLARFEELQPQAPRLKSAAAERFVAHFATRDWDAMAQDFAEDYYCDDRRRVVNAGVRHGRDAAIEDLRVAADVGLLSKVTSEIVAARGKRLILTRLRASGPDHEAIQLDVLQVVEHDADERIAAAVVFDPDDIDAAFAELDARYLAGEAAAHAHTWSVIADAFAALNRHELPELAPDWVDIDHRRGAAFATGEMIAYIHDLFDNEPDFNSYITVVHRLSALGAVVTMASHGTSQQGFQAEWWEIGIFTFDGDLLSRAEVFDEGDLDVALTRFEELHTPARRLENAAGRALDRHYASFRARDWGALAELLTDDSFVDDRRRVTSSGFWGGRDVVIANLRALADAAPTSWSVVATRGERLALTRICSPNRDLSQGEFSSDMLILAELDADERIAAQLAFDVDDVDGAFEELDRRYHAGEAAAHAHIWSVISASYAAMNRNELFATTPDWVNADRRRHAILEEGGLNASLHSLWELVPDIKFRVEAVHRLTELGAVTTHVAHGVSQHGFDAEWRGVEVHTVDGDLISRCEIFDEADLDTALAHFDELHQQTRRLQNAASRSADRFLAYFAAGDWDAMRELLADNLSNDDRRRVVGAGIRYGREAQIADMRATADVWSTDITATVMATRGERLALMRHRFRNRDQGAEAFHTEILGVLEIGADGRAVALVSFDADDFGSAIEELDARYAAGEAAAHVRTWSVVRSTCAALNQRELFPTTPTWVSIDHRPGIAFTPGDLTEYIRAAWNLLSDGGVYLETVHRLSHLGAVVTWAGYATSPEGFDAEFRGINLLTVEGDLINRCEIFDEADLDAALAHFDDLRPQTRRLDNAASQVNQRFWRSFAARDWDTMACLLADDVSTDDRRRVVNAGALHGRDVHLESMRALAALEANMTSSIIATRGERLALTHLNRNLRDGDFGSELLYVIEIDADDRLARGVFFDPDDIDAAFEELENRYLAGEAATHSRTWSVIARAQAGFMRRELPATTPNPVYVDHRSLVASDAVDLTAALHGSWDILTPDINVYVETVHRLGELGAVVTQALKGTSREGFDAEWRMINIFAVEGDLISRCEVFDESDLDAALARSEELID